VLTEAVHIVDGSGFQTRLSTEPPAPTERSGGGTVVTLGRVTGVDDPERLGRVRVCLPGYGGIDAGWLGVLLPGAGRDKGIVALPDVDDAVVVALPREGPADGIVLGSLYGTTTPPDAGVDGGAVRRWSMRTRGGQSIVADDANGVLRLENKAGSRIELGPDHMLLHAETDLTIEAPGRAVTVRAATVDFDHAVL
jgi:phage baseplate assembly protein gpV